MVLNPLHIDRGWFKDNYGRSVILRGVNLGGDSKVPYNPDERTHIPTDFSDHREVSFIGRPFPLEEAELHFTRFKNWGFNVLRLLTTWEAVEHKGPKQYDTKYLDYYTKLCQIAGEYGLYIFVDFHQDVWSRMTGGDGAPCWLFEKIGIDYKKLSASDAALVMQHAYDFDDPRARQEENYPTMCWSQNYRYLGNALMWTLFFGGKIFAPNFKIDGLNVQDYMLDHYLGCLKEIAKRIKDLPNIIGFDSLNEPSTGWIGTKMDDRHLHNTKQDPALPGIAWSPIDCLYSSYGNCVELPYMELSILKGGFVPKRTIKVNKDQINLWIENHTDPFLQEGAWQLKENGNYEILDNSYFQMKNGRPVNFLDDFMAPFFHSVADTIREINNDWLLFAEIPAEEAVFDPTLPQNMPKKVVNATHWYDLTITGTKRVLYPFSMDIRTHKLVIGKKRIQNMYEQQIGEIKKASKLINGGNCPTLLGEFGIPFDLKGGKAYKEWEKGKRDEKLWKKHVSAFNLIYNALDSHLMNGTLWNYSASNRNDLRIGDGWNQEDISIFSEDQRDIPTDLNSGARALQGWCRPYAQYIQGKPIRMKFDFRTKIFILDYEANANIPHPTIIYIPKIHYPKGYRIIAQELEITPDDKNSRIEVLSSTHGKKLIKIDSKK